MVDTLLITRIRGDFSTFVLVLRLHDEAAEDAAVTRLNKYYMSKGETLNFFLGYLLRSKSGGDETFYFLSHEVFFHPGFYILRMARPVQRVADKPITHSLQI